MYTVEPCDGLWEANRYAASTVHLKKPVGLGTCRLLFRTVDEAWTVCDLWYEADRLHSTFAGLLEAIQETPLHALPYEKEESDEPLPFLTQADVEDAEHARIMIMARRQRALGDLCLEFGWEAVLSKNDKRLQAALALDGARKPRGSTILLPRADSDFMDRLTKFIRRHTYHQKCVVHTEKAKAKEDLANHWITLGFKFLSKSALASLINQKHGTNHTPASIAATCRRLGLVAKRRPARLKELSDEYLDAVPIEMPPEFDCTKFYMP